MAHTQGKWRFKPWSDKEGQIVAGKGDAATLVAGAVLNQDGPLLSGAPDLLRALDDIMPPPLCGEAWDLPDAEKTSIVVTFGQLRAARAAIAKATGAAE